MGASGSLAHERLRLRPAQRRRVITYGPDQHERRDVMLGFGHNLRALRAAAGLTLEQLAMRSFVPYHRISAIELGKSAADVPTMLVLGERLGVSPPELTVGLTAPVRRAGTQQVLDLVRQRPGLGTEAYAALLRMPFCYVSEIEMYLEDIGAFGAKRARWSAAREPER
jgi:transcriptional regulator with XRE-family HTH domain